MEKYVNCSIELVPILGICIFAMKVIVQRKVIRTVDANQVRFIIPYNSAIVSYCLGQFGVLQLTDYELQSFQLKTESNGVNEQCLTYYYYMTNIDEQIITVRKEETNGENQMIDTVTSSPFNGWIERKVSFNVQKPGYKVRWF
jgi:hypothetical protein